MPILTSKNYTGYAYYHFSGVKRAIDASKRAKVYLQETKKSVTKKYAGVVSKSLKRASSVIKEKRSKWRKDASKERSDEKTTDP
ncbi:hypothetical protein Hypma_008047 [Hypsizygus marmoreus]|uniref:Uncharacterized protein n=1 Tax=Hypsizygus marmoreus TaxID=39966 RepID=A0A369K1U8_HYPMA|nr:hypothetical protein Hypma_008047 [Hypsizygus marmoreus]